jgi:quercetin dioxygenase-like cupin family protein
MKTMNKVLELSTRIRYKSHRVVRKALLITPKRNMALLAFDKGKNLLTRSVPMDVRFIFLEGKAELSVDGVTNVMSVGSIAHVGTGHVYSLHAPERFKVLMTAEPTLYREVPLRKLLGELFGRWTTSFGGFYNSIANRFSWNRRDLLYGQAG